MKTLTLADQQTRVVRPIPVARASTVDFIWADRIGVLVGAGGIVILAYLWALAAIAAGVPGANHLLQHEIGPGLECDFAAASSVWLFLRMIDLAARGPAQRARHAKR
jgi:hypothetical protein